MTASVTLLASITQKIRPPRALAVPWALGFPLGEPHNATLQRQVLEQLLALLEDDDVPVLQTMA